MDFCIFFLGYRFLGKIDRQAMWGFDAVASCLWGRGCESTLSGFCALCESTHSPICFSYFSQNNCEIGKTLPSPMHPRLMLQTGGGGFQPFDDHGPGGCCGSTRFNKCRHFPFFPEVIRTKLCTSWFVKKIENI